MKSIPTRSSVSRVVAFDPGYERMGVAILERKEGKEVLLYSTCLRTPGTLPFAERLVSLGDAVVALISEWHPDAAALEDIYFENNAKTAMKIAEVRGMLTYIAKSKALHLFHYTPLEVKVAMTGYGKSDKAAVAMMVSRLVTISDKKRLDDELDAIAVGLTCLACER